MIKGICITGMVLGLLLVVLFGIDLALGLPFGVRSIGVVPNICFIVAGLTLAYLGWSLQREST